MLVLEYSAQSLILIADSLKKGDLVSLPTDTLFALCADATNDDAVKKIFTVKKRSPTQALPVFVSSVDQALELVEFDDISLSLAKAYWPGMLTIVLPLKKKCPISKLVVANGDTVALRMPNSKPLLEIMALINSPLTGTSVNISNSPPLNYAQDIEREFPTISWVLDYPKHPRAGQPSTIIKVVNGQLKVIRQGTVDLSDHLSSANE